jgi:SAM-dependent methyltransferase
MRALYAAPQFVTDLGDCYFYHTTLLPGPGLVLGEWDLRAGIRDYLGGVDLAGKRVLEVGTASGFVCFAMEQLGADVVAYDLSPEQAPDIVPFARVDIEQAVRDHQTQVRKLNNAFWLCHRLKGSRARMVYGTAYAIPEAIGLVDVATFGCVLLHLRDPFLALANAARLTRQTLIVTEPLVVRSWLKRLLLRSALGPALVFFPQFRRRAPLTTWWVVTPEVIQHWLGVLGFEDSRVTYHRGQFHGRPVRLFTVVGRRTAGCPVQAELATVAPAASTA